MIIDSDMFKILHTSDWHLGHSFHQYVRDDEFEHFIDQLCEIAKRERPDAVCISGDVFDSMTPGLTAQRQWASSLERLSLLDQEMSVVAISGNHDSGTKFGVYANVFKDNIRVVGRRAEVFALKGHDGTEAVICAAPYVPGSFYRNYLEATGQDAEEPMRAYFARLAAQAQTKKSTESTPVILLAHTAVTGADFQGQDKYKFVFNDVEIFGDGYDYVALGHIHFPQTVKPERPVVRYCGAPLAIGFDESYGHSVSVVTIGEGKVEVREAELDELRVPVTLFADSPLKANEVKGFIKEYKPGRKQYLRLYYLDDGNFTVEHRRQLETAFEADGTVRLCLTVPVLPEVEEETKKSLEDSRITPENIADFDPIDIARRCFVKNKNTEMPDHLLDKLKSIIHEDTED